MRSLSLAGAPTAKSGQPRSPANRFQAPASAAVISTNDTSGPLFTASSPSGALQQSLESRLRALMAANGSPECVLTWKVWDMPSGPPICRLRASVRSSRKPRRGNGWDGPWSIVPIPISPTSCVPLPSGLAARLSLALRTSDSACSGWPTPDAGATPQSYRREPGRERNGNLAALATLAAWVTPAARDFRHPNSQPWSARGGGVKGEQLANQAAHLSPWPTPREQSAQGPRPDRGSQAGADLQTVAHWPTPNAMAGGQTSCGGERKSELLISGLVRAGSPASMAARGALNPAFSRWLMGYPAAWDDCAVMATPSSRRSRRHS